jgi:hypothetical protein
MDLQRELERKIEKKKEEIKHYFQQISSIRRQVEMARVYIEAHEETLRLLPRMNSEQVLRAGSGLEKARDAIKKVGKPLRIEEILAAVGKENTKDARVSLSGSIAHYVRRGEIFTRPAPNTYGLREFETQPIVAEQNQEQSDSELDEVLGPEPVTVSAPNGVAGGGLQGK